MPDPQWSVEFVVNNNETGARREVRIDAPELPDAVAGAVAGIQAIFGSELNRAVGDLTVRMPPGFFGAPAHDPVSGGGDLPNARIDPYQEEPESR